MVFRPFIRHGDHRRQKVSPSGMERELPYLWIWGLVNCASQLNATKSLAARDTPKLATHLEVPVT